MWKYSFKNLKLNGFQHSDFQLRKRSIFQNKRNFCTFAPIPEAFQFCIVGSGPAGFYTTESLKKTFPNAKVDILEKFPIPYGLVRYGVSPDHPEVKNVIHKFEELATEEGTRFFGNVEVGKDISIKNLTSYYDAVILCYGVDGDRMLGIEGEDLPFVYAARDFVGWFNGHPYHSTKTFNLNCNDAVIIGQGNVALDVARILLKSPEDLKGTDITEYSLNHLRSSQVKRVHLIGRRSPVQAAFTTAELREILSLPNTTSIVSKHDLELNEVSKEELDGQRAKKRMFELLTKKTLIVEDIYSHISTSSPPQGKKELLFHFLKSPIRIEKNFNLVLEHNALTGKPNEQKALGTGKMIHLPCGILFRSIGYKSMPIPDVPFDPPQGIIPNEKGKVLKTSGLYVSGWLKRGATGIIGTNKWDAEETVLTIAEDIKEGNLKPKTDSERSPLLLPPHTTSFQDWKLLDEEEVKRGREKGKEREKLVSIPEMLKILKKN